jgi:hypothetical protein
MTKPIPTFNILVAFDKDVFSGLKKAIKQGSFNSFLGSKKDYVLFTNTSDNFIRLSHAYSFLEKSGKDTDNLTITLELLDPGRVFEQNYLANSLKQLLGNRSGDIFGADAAENEIKRLQNILDHPDVKDPDFWKNMGAAINVDGTLENDLYKFGALQNSIIKNKKSLDKNAGEYYNSTEYKVGSFFDALETTNLYTPELKVNKKDNSYEKFLADFEKKRAEYLTDIRKRLDSIQNPISPTTVYISYGCGDDLDNWAGPFLCYMSGAKIGFSAETGFRTITVVFTVNAEFPGLTPNDSAGFQYGRDIQIVSQQPLISIIDHKYLGAVDVFGGQPSVLDPVTAKRDSRISHLGVGKSREEKLAEESPVGGFDFHYAICECIKQYIQKATANKANVVVFFPDLSELLYPLIKSYLNTYSFNDELFDDGTISVTLPNGKTASISKRKLYIIPEVLKELGFDISIEIISDGKIVTSEPEVLMSPNGTQDANSKNVERIKGAISTGKNLALTLIKKPGESFMDPLNRVSSGFSITRVVQPLFMVESNGEFIKDFKKFCDTQANKEKSRRAGIDYNKIRLGDETGRLEEIIEIDETKPLIIYGDKVVLDRFFFSKNVLEDSGLFKFGFGQEDDLTLAKKESEKSAGDPVTSYFNYNKLIAKRDEKYLTSEFKELSKKYFQIPKRDNCFNSYRLPTSQFAFSIQDQIAIQKANIPIFKFGVQDSNVLDIDMDINQHYFAILNSVLYQTTALNRGSRGTQDKTDDAFNILLQLDKNKVADIIKANTVIKPDGTKGLSAAGVNEARKLPEFAEISPKDIEAMFTALIALSGDKTLVQNLDWWKSQNPAVHFTSMLAAMANVAYRGTIRTLPFFHLSNNVNSINPALLFVKETSILGLNKNNSISDVLNGLWRIYGYEHSIGREEAQSAFHIMKDISIQLPNTLTPVGKQSINTINVPDNPKTGVDDFFKSKK